MGRREYVIFMSYRKLARVLKFLARRNFLSLWIYTVHNRSIMQPLGICLYAYFFECVCMLDPQCILFILQIWCSIVCFCSPFLVGDCRDRRNIDRYFLNFVFPFPFSFPTTNLSGKNVIPIQQAILLPHFCPGNRKHRTV